MEGCQFHLYFNDRLPFIHIQDGDLKEGEIKTVKQIQIVHTTIPEAYEWARIVGTNFQNCHHTHSLITEQMLLSMLKIRYFLTFCQKNYVCLPHYSNSVGGGPPCSPPAHTP